MESFQIELSLVDRASAPPDALAPAAPDPSEDAAGSEPAGEDEPE
jgi:hypothetical protein